MKPKQYQFNLLLVLVVALWGSLYIGNRVVLQYIPVPMLLFFRFLISSTIIISLTRLQGVPVPEKADWPKFLVVGILGYWGSNMLLTLCTQLTNGSISSLLNSMNPIFMVFFAYFMLGEAITLKKVVLILTAIAGAAIIIGAPGSNINPLGVVCALLSIVLWSFTAIYMKKLTQKYSPFAVTGYGMAVSTVLAGISGLVDVKVFGATVSFAPEAIGWLLWVSVACTAFAHAMWNFCTSHQEAGHCAAFYPVQPMVSMLLGWLLLGEPMTPSFLLGSALIILSVALNSLPDKKRAK